MAYIMYDKLYITLQRDAYRLLFNEPFQCVFSKKDISHTVAILRKFNLKKVHFKDCKYVDFALHFLDWTW